ncbi:MAG: hypothetical protein ACYC7D_05220 [Nitrososphaerales archaeon]
MSEEDAERLIILMIGSSSRPVPTFIHMQKEMFLLSRSFPKIEDTFHFETHYYGAYSQHLDESIKEPLYYPNSYSYDKRGIFLYGEGKSNFESFARKYKSSESFQLILSSMKMTREIYDKLTYNEFLLLMYLTYPRYIAKSVIFSGLVEDESKKNSLLQSIKRKGLLTDDRFNELMEIGV